MTKYLRTYLALVLFALVFLTGVLPLSPQTSTALARPAVQASAKPQDGRVQTVQLESKLIGATLPYKVMLPVDYELFPRETLSGPLSFAWLVRALQQLDRENESLRVHHELPVHHRYAGRQ